MDYEIMNLKRTPWMIIACLVFIFVGCGKERKAIKEPSVVEKYSEYLAGDDMPGFCGVEFGEDITQESSKFKFLRKRKKHNERESWGKYASYYDVYRVHLKKPIFKIDSVECFVTPKTHRVFAVVLYGEVVPFNIPIPCPHELYVAWEERQTKVMNELLAEKFNKKPGNLPLVFKDGKVSEDARILNSNFPSCVQFQITCPGDPQPWQFIFPDSSGKKIARGIQYSFGIFGIEAKAVDFELEELARKEDAELHEEETKQVIDVL